MSSVEQDPILRQTESQELNKEEKPLLTPRQMEILELTAQGSSYSQICEELKIAYQTVKNYFGARQETQRGIFVRLNACSRREAVVKAIYLGILDLEKFVQEEKLKRLSLLSERETKVISCLADPLLPSAKTTHREIADKLGDISPNTVRNHLNSIFKKLGLKELGPWMKSTRAAVIFLAYQRRKEQQNLCRFQNEILD